MLYSSGLYECYENGRINDYQSNVHFQKFEVTAAMPSDWLNLPTIATEDFASAGFLTAFPAFAIVLGGGAVGS